MLKKSIRDNTNYIDPRANLANKYSSFYRRRTRKKYSSCKSCGSNSRLFVSYEGNEAEPLSPDKFVLLCRKCLNAKMRKLMAEGERNNHIVELYSSGISQPQIAKNLGLSRQRIQQIIAAEANAHA